jgi:putative MATE family efflux protein
MTGGRFQPGYRNIWGISFPIIIAGISESVVEITDTIFLAHYGVTELAAIGMADAIYSLVLFLSLGLVDGIQIIIGRRVGQERDAEIGRVFNQGLYLLALVSLLMIAVVVFAVPLVTAELFASDDVHNAVNRYLQIASYGLLFQSVNLAYSAFYVGISQTRVLIGAALVLAVTNISLDYLLIFGNLGFAEWGIEGAAMASLIAEAATCLYLTWDILNRRHSSRYGLLSFSKWDGGLARKLLAISTPVSMEALVDLSKWTLLIVIIEQLGEGVLASANIIFSCYALFMISIESFSETVCSMVSNLIGQQRRQDLVLLIRRAIRLSYLVVSPLLMITLFFPEWVLGLFTPDEAMIQASLWGLLVILLATLVAVPAETLYSAVAGTGDTRVILVIQLVVTAVTLGIATYAAFWLELALEYILLAEVFGWLTSLVLSWLWFRGGLWRRLEI